MRLIDLSQPVFDECPNCPAHAGVSVRVVATHDGPAGAETWHLEQLSFASHTGSHVDAPLHRLKGGAAIDDFPLERWTGPARVVDFRGIAAGGKMTAAMLEAKLGDGSLAGQWVLLATGFGEKRERTREWLHEGPVVTPEGARWLVEKQVRGVGIDHWSIGDGETHAVLLAAPVLIVEELRYPPEVFSLRGPATFMALPVNLRGHSGAPCRPVLMVSEDAGE
jgi:kynurenine formamidase